MPDCPHGTLQRQTGIWQLSAIGTKRTNSITAMMSANDPNRTSRNRPEARRDGRVLRVGRNCKSHRMVMRLKLVAEGSERISS